MAIGTDEIRALLLRFEPDYSEFERFGAEAVPALTELVRDSDPLIASKAAYAASMTRSADAAPVLERAAAHPEPTVRAATASGAVNLAADEAVAPIVVRLLGDDDPSVRAKAARPASIVPGAQEELTRLAKEDPDESVRAVAERALTVERGGD